MSRSALKSDQLPTHAHADPAEEILEILETTKTGLTQEEAEARLEKYGHNQLPQQGKVNPVLRFLKHFHDPLIYILIAAAGITALLNHWIDTSVILAVVLFNAIIGYIQEGKAEEALAGIRRLLSPSARVQRNGEWEKIEAVNLVPGDVVSLKSGDRVPADLRLFHVNNLRIEESALTGESSPVNKRVDPVEKDSGIGDQSSMAFSGTMVINGRGMGVVTSTGSATQMGKINRMLTDVQVLATPLTIQMTRFGKLLSFAIVLMAAAMFGLGWILHDYNLEELFFASIGFAVAAIPEGLPAVLTITLAIGVQRMANREAITRKLNSVEALGSVTVICSDKTGTLTRNEMTVQHVVTASAKYDVTGTGYEPRGEILLKGEQVKIENKPDLKALIEVMSVNNDSEVREQAESWQVIGEPTEGALRTLGHKADFANHDYERIDVIPFESDRKFMASLEKSPHNDTRILMKGAPDRLLLRCSHQLDADCVAEPLVQEYWESQIELLGSQGFRVLAAAHKDVSTSKKALTLEDVEQDMVFLGVVAILDPPRPEAIKAIDECKRAGIAVKMITGDYKGTALAIGKAMGIGDGKNAVTGLDIEQASDEQLIEMALGCDVFARTSPEHKLRLVEALQARDEVVAMTGDGVNDAPALKRADVGIAMGVKGTEATKEAADIVLADDNFATIAEAVREGRTIYDNLRKSILFALPTNGAESIVILVAVLLGLMLPLLPVQILWVNMVTAVTLMLALAFEPSEPTVMSRPPRKRNAPILDRPFIMRIAFVSILIGGATIGVFVYEKSIGLPLDVARTLAVNTLVAGQAFYLINTRFLTESSLSFATLRTNPKIWIAIGVLCILQLAFVYLPFMNVWFHSAPLEERHWLIPITIGFTVFLAIEAEKLFQRRSIK